MPTYDPLAILERANAHASNWQSALDRAVAQQTATNNTAFADGFARDRVFQLYPSELNRMQSGNEYQTQLAGMQTRLLPDQENAQRTAYRLNASQNGLALQESDGRIRPKTPPRGARCWTTSCNRRPRNCARVRQPMGWSILCSVRARSGTRSRNPPLHSRRRPARLRHMRRPKSGR